MPARTPTRVPACEAGPAINSTPIPDSRQHSPAQRHRCRREVRMLGADWFAGRWRAARAPGCLTSARARWRPVSAASSSRHTYCPENCGRVRRRPQRARGATARHCSASTCRRRTGLHRRPLAVRRPLQVAAFPVLHRIHERLAWGRLPPPIRGSAVIAGRAAGRRRSDGARLGLGWRSVGGRSVFMLASCAARTRGHDQQFPPARDPTEDLPAGHPGRARPGAAVDVS
jgi:hypothetical protein